VDAVICRFRAQRCDPDDASRDSYPSFSCWIPVVDLTAGSAGPPRSRTHWPTPAC